MFATGTSVFRSQISKLAAASGVRATHSACLMACVCSSGSVVGKASLKPWAVRDTSWNTELDVEQPAQVTFLYNYGDSKCDISALVLQRFEPDEALFVDMIWSQPPQIDSTPRGKAKAALWG
jgi:hypothetical protein